MKTRLITPVGTRAVLRIYWGTGCPRYGCHNATKKIADSEKLHDNGLGGSLEDYIDPAAWPTHCDDCGAPVPQGHFLNRGGYENRDLPQYQVFRRTLFDSGLDEIVPGDMWWSEYYAKAWDNEDDARGHLMVKLPNGHSWDIDSRASNCTRKDDRTHRCWVRHGEPPNITVDKNGDTCSAGAGSIIGGDWHGFLRNGELVKC